MINAMKVAVTVRYIWLFVHVFLKRFFQSLGFVLSTLVKQSCVYRASVGSTLRSSVDTTSGPHERPPRNQDGVRIPILLT